MMTKSLNMMFFNFIGVDNWQEKVYEGQKKITNPEHEDDDKVVDNDDDDNSDLVGIDTLQLKGGATLGIVTGTDVVAESGWS